MIVTWHVTWSKILKKEIGGESALFGLIKWINIVYFLRLESKIKVLNDSSLYWGT